MKRNKTKIISFMLVFVMLITLLTGCGSTADLTFDKYGNVIVDYRYYLSEKEYKTLGKDSVFRTFDGHTIDDTTPYDTTTYRNGTLYYVYKFNYKEPLNNGYNYDSVARKGKIGTDEITTYGCLIDTRDKFLSTKEHFKFKKDVFADLTITFKQPIIDSNGVITNDGYTVTWTRDNMNNCEFLYAYSETYLNSRVPWVDIEETDKTFIKRNSTKEKVYLFSIIPFTKITDNGKNILSYGKVVYKDGVYRFQYTWSEKKHNVECKNKVGMIKTKIWVDQTAPKISGVKNGKIYKNPVTITYSDNLSGIYDVTLNGHSIKSGRKVYISGTYKIKAEDKFHNVRYITFRIKK